ncbi:uncharacterized protein EV420DRAFT_1768513 [Desarmillaria tabescens]|uniref:Ecp2 effector protein domain-containing protein n=1 Tax=Armillaria tabescens TaxID=1929756 RepID=A0AA39JKX3_ARMTA|nr:uncharacterized protein EV420DRAFT_1768513 [Desarmillaria tabescens]KAK0443651.1 hypothetical protein EV420DRAFT_1768513 [Desarmillaria tabescens]
MYFSLAFVLFGFALVSPVLSEICEGQVTLSESYIGADKNVKVETVDVVSRQAPSVTNVCGGQCNTFCFTPPGGSPDPNDCHVIANALRYESENTGNLLDLANDSNGNTVVMVYNSCESFFGNEMYGVIEYCRDDWASVIDWMAPNCQSTPGGDCFASDGKWHIQIQHS